MAQKTRALTFLEKRDYVIAVAREIGVSRKTIYQLKRLDALLPPGMVPKMESGSGVPKKTLPRMDKLLKHEVSLYLPTTTFEMKNKHFELLHNISAFQEWISF